MVQETEISLLKERAVTMGIVFHPSIGVKKLRDKINERLNIDASVVVEPKPKQVNKTPQQLLAEKNVHLRKLANRLVRIRVTCMNPNKKDWPGEIFSISNRVIGTIKKFIPFNSEVGYHVPAAILTLMQERQYQTFKEFKLSNNRKQKKGILVKEFSIELLDPLTPLELKELAQRQILSNSID